MEGTRIKALHAGDLHAERPLTGTLSKEKAKIRHKEINGSIERIVEMARNEKCQILLLAGDLFEHTYARGPFVKEVASLFSSIPSIRVFISPGNHDPIVNDSLYLGVDWPPNVKIFSRGEIEEVSLKDLGITIHGLGWRRFMEKERLLRGFRVENPDDFNVLLCHGDFLSKNEESNYLPILPEDLRDSGIDYAALGHVHVPGQFQIGETMAVYSGCPEPLDAGDMGERGVFLVDFERKESGKKRVHAQFIPMALRQVRSLSVDITGLDTIEKVRNAVLSVGDSLSRTRDIWTVTLKGLSDPELEVDVVDLQRELMETHGFFSLKLIPAYAPDYSIDQLVSANTASLEARFAGTLTQMAGEYEKKGDARNAQVAKMALWYGLDALRLGEVLLRGRGSSD